MTVLVLKLVCVCVCCRTAAYRPSAGLRGRGWTRQRMSWSSSLPSVCVLSARATRRWGGALRGSRSFSNPPKTAAAVLSRSSLSLRLCLPFPVSASRWRQRADSPLMLSSLSSVWTPPTAHEHWLRWELMWSKPFFPWAWWCNLRVRFIIWSVSGAPDPAPLIHRLSQIGALPHRCKPAGRRSGKTVHGAACTAAVHAGVSAATSVSTA